jgi:hypothetical protein
MSYEHEQDIKLLQSKEHLLWRNITLISDFEEDCWLWHGSVNNKYGIISLRQQKGEKNIRIFAHRMSYILYVGPIPKGLHCLHTCDEPRCCNPSHLFLGTTKDNTQDMIQKGRGQLTYWSGKTQSEEHRKKNSEGVKKARQLRKW